MKKSEIYISVDVETSGPVPGIFSLLSIGACLVHQAEVAIYLELQPDSPEHDPESIAVTGLDLMQLERDGLPPSVAMHQFKVWIESIIDPGQKAIFVGLNTPFDWSFINYYFYKYIGINPFGFTAIDIKAYFMGAYRYSWSETKSSHMSAILKPYTKPNHNALDDARFQAELFALMLAKQTGEIRSG